MKNLLIVAAYCLLPTACCFSQHITHGPVTGALTANSARMYLRTDAPMPYTIELSDSPSFNGIISFSDSTRPELDNSRIVNVTGLQPYTKYYYRVIIDGFEEERSGSFTTFPTEGTKGNYVLTTGSCQETNNMDVFDRMAELEPERAAHHCGSFRSPRGSDGRGGHRGLRHPGARRRHCLGDGRNDSGHSAACTNTSAQTASASADRGDPRGTRAGRDVPHIASPRRQPLNRCAQLRRHR